MGGEGVKVDRANVHAPVGLVHTLFLHILIPRIVLSGRVETSLHHDLTAGGHRCTRIEVQRVFMSTAIDFVPAAGSIVHVGSGQKVRRE